MDSETLMAINDIADAINSPNWCMIILTAVNVAVVGYFSYLLCKINRKQGKIQKEQINLQINLQYFEKVYPLYKEIKNAEYKLKNILDNLINVILIIDSGKLMYEEYNKIYFLLQDNEAMAKIILNDEDYESFRCIKEMVNNSKTMINILKNCKSTEMFFSDTDDQKKEYILEFANTILDTDSVNINFPLSYIVHNSKRIFNKTNFLLNIEKYCKIKR